MLFNLRRLKDKHLLSGLKESNHEVLINLFERSYVSARNIAINRKLNLEHLNASLRFAVILFYLDVNQNGAYSENDIEGQIVERTIANFNNFTLVQYDDLKHNNIKASLSHLSTKTQNIVLFAAVEAYTIEKIEKLVSGSKRPVEENLQLAWNEFLNGLADIEAISQSALMEQKNLKLNPDEQIERYLSNKMGKQELIDFELKLSFDKELQREYEVKKLIREALTDYRREQLDKYLKKEVTTSLTGNFWPKSWIIASSIIIGATLLAAIILGQNQDSAFQEPNSEIEYRISDDLSIKINYHDLADSNKAWYKFSDKTLDLYGIKKSENIELKEKNDGLILIWNNTEFQIEESQNRRALRP